MQMDEPQTPAPRDDGGPRPMSCTPSPPAVDKCQGTTLQTLAQEYEIEFGVQAHSTHRRHYSLNEQVQRYSECIVFWHVRHRRFPSVCIEAIHRLLERAAALRIDRFVRARLLAIDMRAADRHPAWTDGCWISRGDASKEHPAAWS